MRVVAVPNLRYPPDPDALAAADAVIGTLDELVPAVVEPGETVEDRRAGGAA